MKILFTVSVVLNLVCVGIGAGAVVKSLSHKPWKEMREDLTPEARDALKGHFKNTREQVGPMVQQTKNIQKDLVSILNQPEFDRTAFDIKAEELSVMMGQLSGHKIKSMGDLAESLSYEDRQVMVKKFEKMLSRSLKSRGHRKPNKDNHAERSPRSSSAPSVPRAE
jgi:uncharacterized membrane protein